MPSEMTRSGLMPRTMIVLLAVSISLFQNCLQAAPDPICVANGVCDDGHILLEGLRERR